MTFAASARVACALAVSVAAAAALADDRFDLDQVYDMSPDGTIELETRDADVIITGSDRDDVHVEVHYERKVTGVGSTDHPFDVAVRERGGDLSIRQAKRNIVTFGISRVRYEVLIEAPAGAALDISGDDDDYEIGGIDGAIRLHADDASIRLRNCRGKAFDVALADGDLDMDRGAGSLALTFDDGSADIRNADFSEIRVRGNDGGVRIGGALADDGEYSFEMDDGDVIMDTDGGGGFSVSMQDGAFSLNGGHGELDADFDDGSVTLTDTMLERVDAHFNDGRFDFDGPVPNGARYAIGADDGVVRFRARDGGGRISVRFDDGRVRAHTGVRTVSEERKSAVYEWGDGDASVSIDFNDGSVDLSAD